MKVHCEGRPPGSPVVVYLGLGSNLGDRVAAISAALRALSGRILHEMCASRFYETDAVTSDAQPKYVNAVVRGEALMSAADTMSACLEIEAALGRVRPSGRSKAPRTIDIDLLLYGGDVIDTPTLKVPHPALLQRAFVLIPLADVALPGLRHPITGAVLTSAEPSATVTTLVPLEEEA